MAGIQVQTYPQLLDAQRLLLGIEEESRLGRFRQGEEESFRLGQGFEIDGLRDYVDGDDIRHIDWLRSAARTDGSFFVRQHYADQSPLTVVVSDIPRVERYAGTPGDPLSSQALGFVAVHSLLRAMSRGGAEVLPYWTNGVVDSKKRGVVYSGSSVQKAVLERGLESARISAERAIRLRDEPEKKRGFFGRNKQQETHEIVDELETLPEAIMRASNLALRSSDVARFIIVSDFRDDTHEIMTQLKRLHRFGDSNIVTVQITNPNLRELPASQDIFRTGTKQGAIIESQAQRDAYKKKAAEKQARIDEALKSVSTRTITIDTMQPRFARVA